MAEMGVSVQQQGRSATNSDGTTVTAAGLRQGELVTADPQALYQKWLRAGQVFEAHFATEGGFATIENNTAVDLTEPFLRLTVPSSKIFVPLFVKITPAVVWETGDEYIMYTSDTDTYTTGGAAPDVRNMANVASIDSAIGSATTAMTNVYDGDAALTEAAVTNPRIIDFGHFLTGKLGDPYIYNALNGSNPMTYIHGPASWALMIARTTTTVEAAYVWVWAELDKSELVNS